ncbi:hypothetical protein ACRAWB_14865 [Leifsonia poae]|uniref:hypothetical protein n=1 Tax=Leifsonia poae TaxID=110933 RepID=UPI003D695B84
MRLADLGDRICIIGQSGSGKSTLAAAIGKRLGLPVVHLDQYRHLPGSQWQLRPDDAFAELHDSAIRTERWVIEGNYSKLMPQRLQRATGLIVIDMSTGASLARYVRRALQPAGRRIGGLPGTRDRLSWSMIRYLLLNTRASRRRRRAVFDESTLPKVFLSGSPATRRFYEGEGLDLP